MRAIERKYHFLSVLDPAFAYAYMERRFEYDIFTYLLNTIIELVLYGYTPRISEVYVGAIQSRNSSSPQTAQPTLATEGRNLPTCPSVQRSMKSTNNNK